MEIGDPFVPVGGKSLGRETMELVEVALQGVP
jgi:hypothetical protein